MPTTCISHGTPGSVYSLHLHFAISVFRFPARQSTDGDPRRVSFGHLLAANFPQLEVEAALDDAEEVLRLGFLVGCYTAVEPAYRSLHGFAHAGFVGGGGGYYVV